MKDQEGDTELTERQSDWMQGGGENTYLQESRGIVTARSDDGTVARRVARKSKEQDLIPRVF